MLGTSLYNARKKSGLSQENVAEKLGVTRQTVSKWETNETLPDIRQAKQLAVLYHITLDQLIDFDVDEHNIQQMIDSVSEEVQSKQTGLRYGAKNTLYWQAIRKKYVSTTTHRSYGKCFFNCKRNTDTMPPMLCWF